MLAIWLYSLSESVRTLKSPQAVNHIALTYSEDEAVSVIAVMDVESSENALRS